MTLDFGRCPPWLFERMSRLGRVIALAIISEFGSYEFIKRLSDPVWFQSLGTLMAFDWNASGLTVVTLAALKDALRELEDQADVYICGGKGQTSRKTPNQILSASWKIGFDQKTADRLVYTSKITAKVDSALVQDGFTLYHHNFIFNKKGAWAVIQQGMNTQIQRARRYHWLGSKVKDFIEEPHQGIATQAKLSTVLNLTAKKSETNRQTSLSLLSEKNSLFRGLKHLKILNLPPLEFSHHPVEKEFLTPRLNKNIDKLVAEKPNSFEKLLMTAGIGAKTIRALSLVSEVIYGAKPSYDDPARYSFSFGGKDGTPYPIDRETYDKTLSVLEKAIRVSKLTFKEKDNTLYKISALRSRFVSA